MENRITLEGCKPEPLISYLKALGVLRIVGEQRDTSVKGLWENECFNLITSLDKESLTDFFLDEYSPSPVFRPWAGRSGFYSRGSEKSARTALTSLITQNHERFSKMREVAQAILKLNASLGLDRPPRDDIQYLRLLRSELPDGVIEWLDTCYVLTNDSRGLMPLLGTGGNEGSGNYSSNYMQALVEVLIYTERKESRALLRHSLFHEGSPRLYDLSTGQFAPGAIAEANSVEGFRSKRHLANPWDIVLSTEGALLFAGSATTRFGTSGSTTSFPFVVDPSAAGAHHLGIGDKDSKFEKEFWMPLWAAPAGYKEVKYLFHEGRVQIGRRRPTNGIEFARAVASLGVDRGIGSFVRYARLKRQGDNALAVPIGTFRVRYVRDIRLLDEIDGWLEYLRRACRQERVLARYGHHLRAIEDAILNFSKYGGTSRLQQVLLALGRVERAFAVAGKDETIPPLQHLSPLWIRACDDGSVEFRLACALASIYDSAVGPIRLQLEPVEKNGRYRWIKSRRGMVWGHGSLSHNLAAVLHRRMLEGIRMDTDFLPIGGRIKASLADIQEFLLGRVDERKIGDLFWALSTLRWWEYGEDVHGPRWQIKHSSQISRAYALLKLVHLPGNLVRSHGQWKITYDPNEGIHIPPTPEVLRHLAGRPTEAVRRAAHRLMASGLVPLGTIRNRESAPEFYFTLEHARRVAGALLIPVWEIDSLARMVLRAPALQDAEAQKEVVS